MRTKQEPCTRPASVNNRRRHRHRQNQESGPAQGPHTTAEHVVGWRRRFSSAPDLANERERYQLAAGQTERLEAFPHHLRYGGMPLNRARSSPIPGMNTSGATTCGTSA